MPWTLDKSHRNLLKLTLQPKICSVRTRYIKRPIQTDLLFLTYSGRSNRSDENEKQKRVFVFVDTFSHQMGSEE